MVARDMVNHDAAAGDLLPAQADIVLVFRAQAVGAEQDDPSPEGLWIECPRGYAEHGDVVAKRPRHRAVRESEKDAGGLPGAPPYVLVDEIKRAEGRDVESSPSDAVDVAS